MKALTALRDILLIVVLATAAATASAADKTLPGKENVSTTKSDKTSAAPIAKRKEVAPFIDPTLPLAGFVERVRAERTKCVK